MEGKRGKIEIRKGESREEEKMESGRGYGGGNDREGGVDMEEGEKEGGTEEEEYGRRKGGRAGRGGDLALSIFLTHSCFLVGGGGGGRL